MPDRGNPFLSPKEKVLLFILSFFPCQWNPIFKLQRSLFKTLITAIDNYFICFFKYSCQCKQLVEGYSQMNSPFSILTNGNRFSVYLKQYSFIQRFFSASGNHRGNAIFEKKTLFLLVETDFLANGNNFFSSIFRCSCH